MDITDGSLFGLETATNSGIVQIERDAIPVKGDFTKGDAIHYLGTPYVSNAEVDILTDFKKELVVWISDKLRGLYILFCHHRKLQLEGREDRLVDTWDEFSRTYTKAPAKWSKYELLGQSFDYIMYGGWAKLSKDKKEDFDLAIERECMQKFGLAYKVWERTGKPPKGCLSRLVNKLRGDMNGSLNHRRKTHHKKNILCNTGELSLTSRRVENDKLRMRRKTMIP
jgi:hypothetical protein